MIYRRDSDYYGKVWRAQLNYSLFGNAQGVSVPSGSFQNCAGNTRTNDDRRRDRWRTKLLLAEFVGKHEVMDRPFSQRAADEAWLRLAELS